MRVLDPLLEDICPCITGGVATRGAAPPPASAPSSRRGHVPTRAGPRLVPSSFAATGIFHLAAHSWVPGDSLSSPNLCRPHWEKHGTHAGRVPRTSFCSLAPTSFRSAFSWGKPIPAGWWPFGRTKLERESASCTGVAPSKKMGNHTMEIRFCEFTGRSRNFSETSSSKCRFCPLTPSPHWTWPAMSKSGS